MTAPLTTPEQSRMQGIQDLFDEGLASAGGSLRKGFV